MEKKIQIFGARENNLKNIDLEFKKNNLVVITGVSGSGKSSLAFNTIYSEGQRRYMESFSAYARSFIGNMERPDVDKINGLSPRLAHHHKIQQSIYVTSPYHAYNFYRYEFEEDISIDRKIIPNESVGLITSSTTKS